MKKKNESTSKEEFPGYPQYPSSQDIMNRAERVSLDTEGLPEAKPGEPLPAASLSERIDNTSVERKPEGNTSLPSESDILYTDVDNTELQDRVYPVDFAANDLDVPGAELDDKAEKTGNEDEENNPYSLANLD